GKWGGRKSHVGPSRSSGTGALVRCGIADSQNLYSKNELLTIPAPHVTQPLRQVLGEDKSGGRFASPPFTPQRAACARRRAGRDRAAGVRRGRWRRRG